MSVKISSFSPVAICSGVAPYLVYGLAAATIHSACDALQKKVREERADFLPRLADIAKHMTVMFVRLQAMNFFASTQVARGSQDMVDKGLKMFVVKFFELVCPHNSEDAFTERLMEIIPGTCVEVLITVVKIQVVVLVKALVGGVVYLPVDVACFQGDMRKHCVHGIEFGLWMVADIFVMDSLRELFAARSAGRSINPLVNRSANTTSYSKYGIELIRWSTESIFTSLLIDKKHVRPVA